MTALVKIKSKGVTLSQFVSAAYVAMAGLTSIDISGYKSETYNSEDLSTTNVKTKDPTGYAEPAVIKASGFYDPLHATYTNLEPLILTPVATNFKVVYTDGSSTPVVYSCTGFGLDKKVDMSKAVTTDIELTTSGAPA